LVRYNFPKYEIELELDEDIYFPAEDTFFLIDTVEIPINTRKIIEIGGGSGIISIVLAKNNPKTQFLVSDISFTATKAIRQNLHLNNIDNQVDIICMDKLEAIHNLNSDIIIWNPPYLPEGEEEDDISKLNKLMLVGGKKGYEETYEILDSLRKNKVSTTFYTIFSSLSWSDKDIQRLRKEGIDLEIINKISLFFEKLYLVKINLGERNEKS
jgi:HemK-related putative methylase